MKITIQSTDGRDVIFTEKTIKGSGDFAEKTYVSDKYLIVLNIGTKSVDIDADEFSKMAKAFAQGGVVSTEI